MVAIVGYFLLIGFPDQVITQPVWRFLNEEEIAFILRRINKDRNDANTEAWNFKKWAASGADWKVWSFAMIFL